MILIHAHTSFSLHDLGAILLIEIAIFKHFKDLDFFAQFGSYYLICSNKQLTTGSMKFPDDSTAGGNKTP